MDSGETSLPRLLSSLRTTLHPETYVFATVPVPVPTEKSRDINSFLPVPLGDICLFFREPQQTGNSSGAKDTITLVIPLSTAQRHNVPESTSTSAYGYTYPCRMITCAVHSSLAAVGFMAVLATRLARCGISVNPVSGFYHDHLFVPVERAEEAVDVLARVREEAQAEAEAEADAKAAETKGAAAT
ncbi:hypothetical protein AYO21_00301 [Fonsecaea monophora]|uniref:DUF2241 domain-containing protein n=1 Tax=Fonsecaea monophora TaxID=254056 RepID=A0A177FN13_9EURO|nr:hypothetical protein AYO21_00301 [Fonsecaea monophora]OAG45665.1 hypothetical protein AYO21_00301 [Fonsecaea monophora]